MATAVAKRYGVSLRDLAAANGGMAKLETIVVGSELRIPGGADAPSVRKDEPRAVPPARGQEVKPAPAARPASPAKPAATAETAGAKAAQPSAPPAVRPATHTVRPGESVSSIARMYGISFAALCAANGGMEKLNVISVGKVLTLPQDWASGGTDASAPARASEPRPAASKPMKAAEAVTPKSAGASSPAKGIPASSSVPAASSAAGSGAPEASKRPAGVPEAAGASSGKPAVAEKQLGGASAPETYTVQAGDTVWSIARRFGLSPSKILSANGMDESVRLRTGDTIRLKK